MNIVLGERKDCMHSEKKKVELKNKTKLWPLVDRQMAHIPVDGPTPMCICANRAQWLVTEKGSNVGREMH